MPKLTHKGKSVEIAGGEKLFPYFDKVGIVYGCHSGNCGKCIVEIKSGGGSLNERQDAEEAFGLSQSERLLCQCVMGDSDVEVYQE